MATELRARGVTTLLVVTDPFHEDRAMAIAATFGFEPMPDPTPTSPITGWRTLPYVLKETVAVAVELLDNLAHDKARAHTHIDTDTQAHAHRHRDRERGALTQTH